MWPLSTPDFPKHLLKLGGEEKSLLQNAYARAQKLTNKIYVITDASHAHHVQDQLPGLSSEELIIEPARRGTASCIIAALAHLAPRHPSDEPIAFMPADHYIRDIEGFEHSFKMADSIVRQKQRLVLVGVEPDQPATGFGYIQKGALFDEAKLVFEVQSFHEKPDFDTAQKFLRSGKYLWNCGYFVGSNDIFAAAMQAHSPGLHDSYRQLLDSQGDEYVETYLALENIAIDYALIEKVTDLLVVPAAFDWMDLGSYGDLSKAVTTDEIGNHFTGSSIHVEEVQNTYIENQEQKPVVVIGLDNCVVVNTPHGILVTRKDLSQKVGDVSKRLTTN